MPACAAELYTVLNHKGRTGSGREVNIGGGGKAITCKSPHVEMPYRNVKRKTRKIRFLSFRVMES